MSKPRIDSVSEAFLLNRWIAHVSTSIYNGKVKPIKRKNRYEIQWKNVKNDIRSLVSNPLQVMPAIAYSLAAIWFIIQGKHLEAYMTSFSIGLISVDSSTQSTTGGEPSSISWTHTIGTNARRMVVVSASGLSTPNDPKWNTLAMTAIVSSAPTTAKYYLNPTSGANTASVDGGNVKVGVSISFYSVNTSTPIGATASNDGGVSSHGMNLTTTKAESIRVDILGANRDDTVSPTASLDQGTLQANPVISSNQFRIGLFMYTNAVATAGLTTRTWTTTAFTREYLSFEVISSSHTKTNNMKLKVVNNNHWLGMKLKIKKRTTKTLDMKVRVYNPYTPGRLRDLEIRSIDIQKFTKDTAQAQVATALSTNLCNFLAAQYNLTHIATVALIDPVSIYPGGFSVSPLTAVQYNKQWCDAIHATGLKVVHRMTSMAMEGSPNFTAWPPVNTLTPGSYTSVVPTTVIDSFDRVLIGSSYVTTGVSGGTWLINNGELVLLNAGNEFTYNLCRTTATYVDGTFQGTVEKTSFGHDGIVVSGSITSINPYISGYGIHMSGTNTLSLEDLGARNIQTDTRSILASDTSTTFTTGNFYNIKVVKSGTSIKIRVWDVNNTEPGTYQIDTTSSLYSSGWFAFTSDGFGKNVHFDNLNITPGQDLNNYIGMVYNWIINNSNTFEDNDVLAPFPEFDTCQDFTTHCYFNPNASWLHAQYGQNTTNFFNALKDVEDLAASQIGKRLKTGFTTYNYTSIQSVTDPSKYPPAFNDLDYKDYQGKTMMSKTGSIVVDWYGTEAVTLFNPSGVSHPPKEMYDSLYAIWNKYNLPIFLQEWGGFRSIDLNDVSAHDKYYRDIFNYFADLSDLGALTRFSYWGAQDTGDADTGLLRNTSINWVSPSLRVKGEVLKEFYQSGTPKTRDLKMKVRNKVTPKTKSLSMKLSISQYSGHGRLSKLTLRGVDLMKWTKDTTTSQPSDATIHNVVTFAGENLNVTHLGLCFPIDPHSFYPNGYVPGPRTIVQCYQKWVDTIHSAGLNVLHRPVSFGMEGDNGFTRLVYTHRYPAGNASDVVHNVDRANWLGILYNFIIDNPTLFHDGDEFAPFPERTEGLFDQPDGIHSFLPDPIQSNYLSFFIDVKIVCDFAFAAIGKNVHTGATADNYSEVRSQYIGQQLYTNSGQVPFDYYLNYNGDGYGKDALSEDLDSVYYARSNLPIFWEEFGPTPDMIRNNNMAVNQPDGSEGLIADDSGVLHTLTYWNLIARPDRRSKFVTDILGTVADKYDQGKLFKFQWWGFWDTGDNDTGLIRINGSSENIGNYSLRPDALILQDYLSDSQTGNKTLQMRVSVERNTSFKRRPKIYVREEF